ncbi:MAG: hypothetical protein LC109_02430 [Bacteroidia bacterium]|nr:hypothetical protein [Bacteroidia bacterium]
MNNYPATPDEVYDSICEAIQKQIDILDNSPILLSNEQIQDILKRIGRLNKQLDEYAKRNMKK